MRKRRVRQDALDVVLLHRNECRQQRGESSDISNDVERAGIQQKENAAEHVNTRRDHRGGVDQSAHWGRASMASASQTCSGNCADLPTAPQKINSPATVPTAPAGPDYF